MSYWLEEKEDGYCHTLKDFLPCGRVAVWLAVIVAGLIVVWAFA